MLTVSNCTEIVRQRLNLPDDSQAARIIAQIPTSLKQFGRRYAADPFTRPLVSTDKSTTTLTIGAGGKVNLVTGYDSFQFLLEYLDKGQIYLLPAVTVAGSPATGTLSFQKPIESGDTITVNGVTFTYEPIRESIGTTIAFTDDQVANAAETASVLNASTNGLLTVASYSSNFNVVTITYDTNGTTGNAFTLVGATSHIVASDTTLTGGSSAVDTTFDTITIATLINTFENFDRVRFTTTGSLPTGLALATDYYLVNYNNGTTQLSSSSNGLTLIDLQSAGSGVLTMTKMDATGNQMQLLKNPQQMGLPQYLDNVFTYATVQADTLYIQQIAGNYPAGTVALSVPAYPLNLAALPDSEEAELLFLSILTEAVAMPVQPV